MEFVEYSVDDGIAHIALNRPAKMNAVVPQLLLDIEAACDAAGKDRTVRAVVLSGNGRAFCAGLDMSGFEQMAGDGERYATLAPRTRGLANEGQIIPLLFRELRVPVICAIHGVALGAGLQMTLGADIRYVAPDARLAFLEMRWGLVPDMGAFTLLRDLVRGDVARDLIMSGRMVEGVEAVSLGLATRVEQDPLAAAFETARKLAGYSPDSLASAKLLLNAMADSDAAALLLNESVRQDMLISSPNQKEAVNATLEKRPGRFAPRSIDW
ncbi:MAG: crotonase/enoyl-CoA hydratase family protein [Sphingobium sp.]